MLTTRRLAPNAVKGRPKGALNRTAVEVTLFYYGYKRRETLQVTAGVDLIARLNAGRQRLAGYEQSEGHGDA